MLTVSEEAAQAISSLVAENGMPEGSGLRIARQKGDESTKSEGLGLSIAARPAQDDEVVESGGVRVFLPPNLVNLMQDMVLNAQRINQDGEETFDFTVDRKPMTDSKGGGGGPGAALSFPTEMPE